MRCRTGRTGTVSGETFWDGVICVLLDEQTDLAWVSKLSRLLGTLLLFSDSVGDGLGFRRFPTVVASGPAELFVLGQEYLRITMPGELSGGAVVNDLGGRAIGGFGECMSARVSLETDGRR